MSRSSITTVTFDVGNTLLTCDPNPAGIYSEILSRRGRAVSPDEIEPVFAAAWAEMQERTPPGIDRYGSQPGGEKMWWGAFLREVLARLGFQTAWEPLLDELYAAFSRPEIWKLYPETPGTLGALRTRGIDMAVISNWDRRLPEILDNLELTDFFSTITVSAIEGVEKPAAEIFARTLQRLGAEPGETIHIGDSPLEDYDGSRAAGMTAVLIDRPGAFVGNGYRRIDRLDEVLELVGREVDS